MLWHKQLSLDSSYLMYTSSDDTVYMKWLHHTICYSTVDLM